MRELLLGVDKRGFTQCVGRGGGIGKLRGTDRESERWQSRGQGERQAEDDRTKKKPGGRATE